MQPESLILVVLLAGMLLLMFNRSRRQQRDAKNLQSTIAAGTRIMTTAGLFATVVELDDTSVTLETAPGQRSRWDRRAIARVVADEPVVGAEPATPADDVEPVVGAEPVEGRSLLAEPGVDPDPVVRPVDEAAANHPAPPDRA
jgi:preprotein translocase subunit YajC